MAFSPRVTFDIADEHRSVRFSVDAADLRPIPDLAIPPHTYLALAGALSDALRDPVDSTDAVDLADLALLLVVFHRLHGPDARQSFSFALRVFDPVVVALALTDRQVGFSIGSDGTAKELRARLDRMTGASETGETGQWPVAVQAAH